MTWQQQLEPAQLQSTLTSPSLLAVRGWSAAERQRRRQKDSVVWRSVRARSRVKAASVTSGWP